MLDALEPDTRALVAPRLQPRQRARGASCEGRAPLTFASLWPAIRLITTWTGGSCGIALDKLRHTAAARDARSWSSGISPPSSAARSRSRRRRRAGCRRCIITSSSSSSRRAGTAANPEFLDARTARARQPLLHPGDDRRRAVPLFHERSRRGDRTVRQHAAPEVCPEGKGVTSLTGEKLYEAQVIQAVQDTARRHGVAAAFFLLRRERGAVVVHPLPRAGRRGRRAAGRFADDVDARLGELNLEYHSKRASGRLGPLTVAWLTGGAAEAYKAACVQGGPARGAVQAGRASVSTGPGVVTRAVCHPAECPRRAVASSGSCAFRSRWRFDMPPPSVRKRRACGSKRSRRMEPSDAANRARGRMSPARRSTTARAFVAESRGRGPRRGHQP